MKIKTARSAAPCKMLVFNLGFTSSKIISGGDVLFMDLARRLKFTLEQAGRPAVEITIVVPEKGYAHWQRCGEFGSVTFKVLKPNYFDRFENPLATFGTYIIRIFQVLCFFGKYRYYYSCSDVFVDVLPPFILRFFHPSTIWISRVYHIFLEVGQRRGSILINLVSTRLQRFSWVLMRLKSQKILALNGKLAKDLEKFGFKDLPVLEAGVDLEYIKTVKSSADRFDACFVGRLSRTKGVYDLLDVWEQVVEDLPRARLAVIGGGPESIKKGLGTRIEELGLKKNVAMLGFVENKGEVYSLLKSAEVFLFPSHEEGWGLAVAEAMACGLPVVGYDLDIFGAVFKDGFTTAPLFDTAAFAKQVTKILVDSDYQKTLSREALKESAKFDNERVAKEFIKYV